MNPTNIPYLDFTWNPMHGCTPIAEGCLHCWAAKMAKRQAAMGNRGYDKADPFKVVFDSRRLREPRSRARPARIGVSFMGDLYHKDVRNCDLDDVEKVMRHEKRHTFVVLTKRPERMARRVSYLLEAGLTQPAREPAQNIWRGTSASTQADLGANVPALLRCPAALRWLSLEPLIEEVDLLPWLADIVCGNCGWLGYDDADEDGGGTLLVYNGVRDQEGHWVCPSCEADAESSMLDNKPGYNPCGEDAHLGWVVIGCESGTGRRPCKLEWIESMVDQCKIAGVPCYVKQIDWHGKVIIPGDPNWPEWAKQEMP